LEQLDFKPAQAPWRANLFSMVERAKANGVEPHAYLSLLFARLSYAKTLEEFEALLPWNAKATLEGRQ
jgi:transposase